jgi:hypothetical protein
MTVTTERLFTVLSSFHPLSEAFREALSRELQIVSRPKNYFLIQGSTTPVTAFFMEKGFAVSYFFYENKKIVTSFYKAGAFIFSPKSFFAQLPTDEMTQLTIDSVLLGVSYASVTKLFETFPEANTLSRAITAHYHHESVQHITDFHTMNASDRYRKLLKNYPGIELNASQELIASFLNITPQSLSRIRKTRN